MGWHQDHGFALQAKAMVKSCLKMGQPGLTATSRLVCFLLLDSVYPVLQFDVLARVWDRAEQSYAAQHCTVLRCIALNYRQDLFLVLLKPYCPTFGKGNEPPPCNKLNGRQDLLPKSNLDKFLKHCSQQSNIAL